MEEKLNCRKCKGKCNKKGCPCVTKHSAYCDKQRKKLTVEKLSFWKRFKKYLEKQTTDLKKHGFRQRKGLEKDLLDKLEKEGKNEYNIALDFKTYM